MIPLSEPQFGGNEWKYVKECIDTGWVSSAGPFIKRLEREFASLIGAAHAVATVNGTSALHAALLCVGVKPGDEVLVPNLTFVAPANAVRYCGAHPVFMDADAATWQIDAWKVERFLAEECEARPGGLFNKSTGRRVTAIVPAHLLGLACEVDRIVESARRRGLKVVEDAAEGLGVRYRGRHVGTYGDAAAFSFNGNKIVTSGGGGMIATNDPEIARRAAYLTTQAKDDAAEYIHNEVGYNYRLTNLQAALGLAQLEQLDGFVASKRRTAAAYASAFAKIPSITPMPLTPHTDATFWLYTILMERSTTLGERKAFIKRLAAQGVESRPLWHTLCDLPAFAGCQGYAIEHSPRLYERSVSLPSSASLSAADLQLCLAAFAACLGRPA